MLRESRFSSSDAVESRSPRCAPWDRFGALPKIKLLSRSEAEALVRELQGALRTLDQAERMASGGSNCPTALLPEDAAPRACRALYPFRDHRTLAEVWAEGDAE